jgi:hypothetical protein
VIPVEGFEISPYVGLAVLGLAAFALWAARKRREVWYFGGLAVCGVLYALGPATPVHRLVYALVPLADKARSPEHAIYVSQFALISLAALCFDRIRVKPRLIQGLLMALLFCEGYAGRFTRIHPISEAPVLDMLRQYDEALDFLEKQPRPFRFLIRSADKPNVGAWRGLEDSNGYLASVSVELYDFFGRDWRGAELTMNTVYEIAREPFDEQQQEAFHGRSRWNVYRNPDARPRVWFEGAPEGCAASAEYRRIHSQQVEIEAELGCAAELVIADPFFPGWSARVDGQEVELGTFRDALMQVELEPGSHRVELAYQPASVLAGGAMTAVASLVCCLAIVPLIRRRAG